MDEVLDPTEVRALDRPLAVDGQTFTHSASGRTKAQGVADAINRLLQNLVIKCAKSEGVRDYFEVGVIGYGSNTAAGSVAPALGGAIAGREIVKISEIAENPTRIDERVKKTDDGAGGLLEQKVKFPIWFDPVADGGTPMCAAIQRARDILDRWVQAHQLSFPPIVINVTDGESTDGDPSTVAAGLKSLSTSDGNLLLFNVHISARGGGQVEFPDTDRSLPDEYARLLFQISSVLPPHMQAMARQEGVHTTELSRGFVYNGDMVSVIRFLDIGTRPSNLR